MTILIISHDDFNYDISQLVRPSVMTVVSLTISYGRLIQYSVCTQWLGAVNQVGTQF